MYAISLPLWVKSMENSKYNTQESCVVGTKLSSRALREGWRWPKIDTSSSSSSNDSNFSPILIDLKWVRTKKMQEIGCTFCILFNLKNVHYLESHHPWWFQLFCSWPHVVSCRFPLRKRICRPPNQGWSAAEPQLSSPELGPQTNLQGSSATDWLRWFFFTWKIILDIST